MTYKAPDVKASDVTPEFVRDQLLLCFESANKEFSKLLNQNVDDKLLREQVLNYVKTVFQGCGVSFENPTKEGIITAINQCKANAERMMGEKGREIIDHHYNEMMKLVRMLK